MTPELTEVQKLKLENFTLRHIAFESQMRQNQLDRAQFIHTIEQAHPGWRWEDPQGLVENEEYEATGQPPHTKANGSARKPTKQFPEMTPH